MPHIYTVPVPAVRFSHHDTHHSHRDIQQPATGYPWAVPPSSKPNPTRVLARSSLLSFALSRQTRVNRKPIRQHAECWVPRIMPQGSRERYATILGSLVPPGTRIRLQRTIFHVSRKILEVQGGQKSLRSVCLSTRATTAKPVVIVLNTFLFARCLPWSLAYFTHMQM